MRKRIQSGLLVLLFAGFAAVAAGGVRVASVVTGHGLGKLAGSRTVTFIQGHRMRSESQVGKKTLASIIDLDAQQVVILNRKKKRAEVYDLGELAQGLRKIPGDEMTVKVKPTGATKTLLGRTVHQYHVYIRTVAVADASQPLYVVIDGSFWMARESPGLADYRGFYEALVKKGLFFTNPALTKAQPGRAKAMATLNGELAKAGFAYESHQSVRFEGGGLAGMLNKLGKATMSTVVTGITVEKIPAEVFAIPSGYKVKYKTNKRKRQ